MITLERNYRSTQAILDASNAVIALARERFTKNLATERGVGERPRLVTVRDEVRRRREFVARATCSQQRENGIDAQAPGGAVSHVEPQRAARARARAPQHSVREIRRPQVPRCRARQGRAVDAALGRQPARPARGLSRAAPAARRRSRERRRAGSTRSTHARMPARRSATLPLPAAARGAWPLLSRCYARCAPPTRRLARRHRRRARLVRAAAGAPVRRRAAARAPISRSCAGSPRRIRRRERFLTELTLDPPAATSDEADAPLHRRRLPRRCRRSIRRRARNGAVVHGAELRRRLHPVRHGHGTRRGDRGGTAAALRRDDAREGRASRSSCRSGSTCAQQTQRAATGTSTRRAAASSRTRSARFSTP